MGIKKTPAKQ
jgi:tetratricopeptide (TPR) repeat protein